MNEDFIIEHGAETMAAAAAQAGEPAGDVIQEDAPQKIAGLPDGVSQDGDGFVIRLDFPVVLKFKAGEKVREERYETLRARRMNGGDLRAMMTSERADGALLLLERILDLPTARAAQVLDRLDGVDMGRALQLVGFLSPKLPRTGG
ncbi:hypothetical protein [Acidiphilium multivorum]|uniref:hypothetical protein n=1 Tax=Acidiphilium multivorum TaxID=62140 RepID=UPI001B8B2AD7|nr:hypothetical protein [Acidiphilium multivorum]MBS3025342.1 hypothetical protein [Acidiphilium multivorum]